MERYDVIIIGAGPAGLTSAIYATRANLKTLLIEKETPGGKLIKTYHIENYPGINDITGVDLAMQMMSHGISFGAKLEYGNVLKVELDNDDKIVILDNDKKFIAKALIVATGTKERLLEIDHALEYIGRGISYCAICDGAFYKNKDVVVIGGGNSALEEAIYLTQLVNQVIIIIRRDEFRADKLVVDKALNNPKIKIITKSLPEELIINDNKIIGLRIKNVDTNEITDINCSGIFPYIGADPATSFLKTLNILDEKGYMIVNNQMETNIKGIYGAGDVIVKDLRQVVTATSDGAIAANNVAKYIQNI